MITYAKFRPTGCDVAGLNAEAVGAAWLVSLGQNRDSDALERSNFRVHVRELARLDPEASDHAIHRFGHWACGWFEIVIVRPGSACAEEAEGTEAALSDYPVLHDEDFSELEREEADEVWRSCYNDAKRIEYIRDNRSQFEFRSFADLLGCARGNYFAGYASELLS